jgi:putative FmdB family regulatory protein
MMIPELRKRETINRTIGVQKLMPTYEYHCDACEHNFDEFQSINDKPLKKCPKCGKLKLRRVFGAGAAIIFKGSGFYQTDYRSESYKAAAKAEQESSKSDKASADGKADAKAEGKADGAAKETKPAKAKERTSKSAK